MHIIIAVLTAAAGLIWALYRLQNSGVDLNGFNPFYWMRRRAWAKKVGAKPLHQLENPMEAAATLVVAMAELEGAVTSDQKQQVLDLFIEEFNVDMRKASDLYGAASYLIKDCMSVTAEVRKILEPTLGLFEERHKQSLKIMLEKTKDNAIQSNQEQEELLDAVLNELTGTTGKENAW